MTEGALGAYDRFLQSGKVEDYLKYIDADRRAQQIGAADGLTATGEQRAYHDRRDRAAGAGG